VISSEPFTNGQVVAGEKDDQRLRVFEVSEFVGLAVGGGKGEIRGFLPQLLMCKPYYAS